MLSQVLGGLLSAIVLAAVVLLTGCSDGETVTQRPHTVACALDGSAYSITEVNGNRWYTQKLSAESAQRLCGKPAAPSQPKVML